MKLTGRIYSRLWLAIMAARVRRSGMDMISSSHISCCMAKGKKTKEIRTEATARVSSSALLVNTCLILRPCLIMVH